MHTADLFRRTYGGEASSKEPQSRTAVLITTAVLDLAVLGFFKYATFALSNFNILLNNFGLGVPLPSIILPIGLSFFVFQSTSYLFNASGAAKLSKYLGKYIDETYNLPDHRGDEYYGSWEAFAKMSQEKRKANAN